MSSSAEREWRPSWAVLGPGRAAPPSEVMGRPRAERAAAVEAREIRRRAELRRAVERGRE